MRTLKQFLFTALMLCAGFACAQQTQNNSGFITSTQCVLVPAGGLNTGGYGVTGTWTGTLTAYGVVGQGSATPLGSATSNGSYTVSIAGYTLFEVCGNTVGSGAAFVQVTASSAGGGSSSGGCIATVSSLSSSCGTKPGTLASVTDGSTTSDCTVGGGSNKNACIYSGSAWGFAGNSGSAPTYAQVGTGTNTSATFTTGSGGTLNVASGAVIDFSLIGTGTFKIPASAGCTTSATKNICLDSTTGLLHVYQSAADAVFASGAFAAAYSLPTATNSVLGGVKPDGTSILNSGGAISVTPTSIGLGNVTNNAQLPLSGGTMTGKLITLAPTTGGAGLNLPHGTAPTSPVNGDCWTTTLGLYCQIAGSTIGPYGTGSGGVSGLTTGYIPKAGSATSIVNSSCDDGITTANTFTCSDSAGITASAGPLTAGNPSGGVGSSLKLTQEGTVPSGLSTSGQDNCYADSTQHGLLCNFNAGTTLPLVQGPASSTNLDLAELSGANGGKVIDSNIATANVVTAASNYTSGNLVKAAASNKTTSDSGIAAANVVTASSPGVGLCHFAGSTQNCTSSAVVGGDMTNNTVTATQLAAQYSKGSCTEVWGGTNTGNALQSGDDAISNNTCYNDSGVTRTITAVKCRADIASNTTTVNPTFGSAGTGTTILSGALTCGSSYAYSSTGTVSNASWTTGSGIDPAMGGTLTGTSIAMIVEYTY